jgi:phenol 2-monooxygenase
LSAADGPIQTFTPKDQDIDSLIEIILIGHGKRHDVELEQIPECFYPVTGKNQTRGADALIFNLPTMPNLEYLDLHKIYYDDESYNDGHGHAYEYLGIDPAQGALIIVRPDQCR